MSWSLSSKVEIKNTDTGMWQRPADIKDGDDGFGYTFMQIATIFRDYHKMPKIAENKMWRGLPDEKTSEYLSTETGFSWWADHKETKAEQIREGDNNNLSWITLAELLAYDFDQQYEDMYSYEHNAEVLPGEGIMTTPRETLGDYFFNYVEYLKGLGDPENVRIIYWVI